MPAWHGHSTSRPSHFTGICTWNVDSKIKPKLSETFLDITWAFLVCSKKKNQFLSLPTLCSRPSYHHADPGTVEKQINDMKKRASTLNKQEIVCVIIITRFPSRKEIKPAYVTCSVPFERRNRCTVSTNQIIVSQLKCPPNAIHVVPIKPISCPK